MKKYILTIIILSAFFLNSCIEEINLQTDEERRVLVVEGFISTVPGPHYFNLTRSAKYGSIFEGYSERINDASIFVRDSEGGQIYLQPEGFGRYSTPVGFQAKVGLSYTMIINARGAQYVSTPETVVPVPEVKELVVEFSEDPALYEFQFKTGVSIYSRFDDPEDEQNFILWTSNAVYEFNSRPDLFVIPSEGGPAIPAPKECCDTCWKYENERNSSLNLYSDNLSNGNSVRPLALYIGDDGFRFQNRYMVVLDQNSLTREAFQFYKLLNEQLSISGDIFDPPPANITGNFINLSNPDDPVIGYFHAADTQRDTIFIDADFITRKIPNKIINNDCRTIFNAFAEPPAYW